MFCFKTKFCPSLHTHKKKNLATPLRYLNTRRMVAFCLFASALPSHNKFAIDCLFYYSFIVIIEQCKN